MKFSPKDLIELIHGDEPDGFELVDDGDWILDHKYEIKELVFRYEGKTYLLSSYRSGSYYSDYYYEYEDWSGPVEVPECRPVQKTITTWEIVK